MKKINRIWSLGLIVVVLASLLMFAAPAKPAAAGNPLQFNLEVVPSASNYQIFAAGSTENVTDIAVGGDGQTIYAATGATSIYKSTNGGNSWVAIPSTNGNQAAIHPTLVAVAPDNNNLVAIATQNVTTDALTVYISTNGGASWGTLGTPTAATAITKIDVSALAQGNNYLAVAGQTAAAVGEAWYYALGIGGVWTQASTKTGYQVSTSALDAKFSPSFASDMVLTVVTTNSTPATVFQMFSVNQLKWNATAAFTSYPVTVLAATAATSASIALAPTYLGGDETSRVAFVGVATAVTTTNGIYRLQDTTVAYIKTGNDIYSVTYDGNTLVGGETTRHIVWRSADPLNTTPTFFPSTDTKSPGGPATTNTLVAYAGTKVVAGTTGAECAFSVSVDAGASFNDLSLVRAELVGVGGYAGTMRTVSVGGDGSTLYLLTKDANGTSLWRQMNSLWQRVLIIAGVGSYYVRTNSTNPQVIYITAIGGTEMYYSKAGGDTKWYTRTGPAALGAFWVEDDNVAYATSAGNVYKTLNGGFTWSTPVDALTGGTIKGINIAGAGNVYVGADNGYVSYSTDGAATWTKIPQPVGGNAANVNVGATGLTSGSLLYAALGSTAQGYPGIWTWTIGQDPATAWYNTSPSTTVNVTALRLDARSNFLYCDSTISAGVNNYSVIYRNNTWNVPSPPPYDAIPAVYGSANLSFNTAFGLVTTATSKRIYLVDTITNQLFSYEDTMAVTAPTLSSPTDKILIPVNSISGNVYNVTVTWPAVNGVVYPTGTYELLVTTDKEATQVFTDPTTITFAGAVVSYTIQGLNPNTTYYWKVRTKLPVTSIWSEQRSFTTGTTPEIVPQILTPIDGAVTSETTPSFSWSPIAGATQYQFQLALNTDFTPTMVDQKVATPGVRPIVKLNTDMVYFWRVRSTLPIVGGWSTVSNFKVTAPVEVAPPVVVTQQPPPVINLPPITMPPAVVNLPPTPAPQPVISTGLLWAVIIIGAVLVIALIVLIVRTRRSV